ncbi:MAG: DUF5060 domain-containing protein [Candidatus Hinthialibacter antarcticus]|nr:DUF5060 domain-containing protein [Candidatus Hinthialibacter antarcticus]
MIRVIAFSVFFLLVATTSNAVEIERWHPHTFHFTSEQSVENPFEVAFSATVQPPAGEAFETLGFYSGDNTWSLRIAPNQTGAWSLQTHSDQKPLENQRVEFTCTDNTNPNVHGGLTIDPEHTRHFVYEDGTRFFLMGYECDWLWAIDLATPNLDRTQNFIDHIQTFGFNYIILNAFAFDTSWQKGNTSPDDFGPPAMVPWEGSNFNPDHSRLNLKYWQHFDQVVDALFQRGVIAHLMIKVYNKEVKWPELKSAEDDLYFKNLIARYAAYPNIVWDFSKEAHLEKDVAYKQDRMRLVREHDPYHRLITVHDDNPAYESGAYNGIVDFRSDQQHKNWGATLLQQQKQHQWPIVNVEYGYEHGPGGLEDKTWRVAQTPEEVARRTWEIVMSGGYPVYYYTHTAWDVVKTQHTPPGYHYLKNLKDFFKQVPFWQMTPNPKIVNKGFCLNIPQKEYIVYQQAPFEFELFVEGLSAPMRAQWLRPFSGETLSAGTLLNGRNRFTPPSNWKAGPVVLHAK